MNAKVFLLGMAMLAGKARAADFPSQFDVDMQRAFPLDRAERMENFISVRRDSPVIALGKSDFVFSGPLVQGFRRLPRVENLNRFQRFLRLPGIRLFVPGPMEQPPETGRYFAWRSEDCALPWTLAASRPGLMKGPN